MADEPSPDSSDQDTSAHREDADERSARDAQKRAADQTDRQEDREQPPDRCGRCSLDLRTVAGGNDLSMHDEGHHPPRLPLARAQIRTHDQAQVSVGNAALEAQEPGSPTLGLVVIADCAPESIEDVVPPQIRMETERDRYRVGEHRRDIHPTSIALRTKDATRTTAEHRPCTRVR